MAEDGIPAGEMIESGLQSWLRTIPNTRNGRMLVSCSGTAAEARSIQSGAF
jgi:hypothetical protein